MNKRLDGVLYSRKGMVKFEKMALPVSRITESLAENGPMIFQLLNQQPLSLVKWRPQPEKWNLLEIICHLVDEEERDFRARVAHVLFQPEMPMPAIDPVGWVTAHNYAEQNFEEKLNAFIEQRDHSIQWLRNHAAANWDNAFMHPKLGEMSARLFLHNWLAHDYLHIRQILSNKYLYLQQEGGIGLDYAGKW